MVDGPGKRATGKGHSSQGLGPIGASADLHSISARLLLLARNRKPIQYSLPAEYAHIRICLFSMGKDQTSSGLSSRRSARLLSRGTHSRIVQSGSTASAEAPVAQSTRCLAFLLRTDPNDAGARLAFH